MLSFYLQDTYMTYRSITRRQGKICAMQGDSFGLAGQHPAEFQGHIRFLLSISRYLLRILQVLSGAFQFLIAVSQCSTGATLNLYKAASAARLVRAIPTVVSLFPVF